jgi:hypothetical protein
MRVTRTAALSLAAWGFACISLCTSAFATITASPPSVSAKPGQNTGIVNVSLTFTPASIPGTGTIAFGGLPAGLTTIPTPVTYDYAVASPASSTSFRFAIGSSVSPGTYAITLQDATRDAGFTTMMLTVTPPSYTMTATPNPLTLTIGGTPRTLTVNTQDDTGFNESSITYTIGGLPAFILHDGPKQTNGPGYGPVSFSLSTDSAPPGPYGGIVTGQSSGGQTRTIPIIVIVQQTDVNATFGTPSMTLCNGAAPAPNTIQLAPLNGYNGTPQLTFTVVPPGITIVPLSPTANAMPPAQVVPFTVAANGATPGVKSVTLNVSDPSAGINRNITLTVNVGAADFNASVAPSAITLTPGGAPQSVSASIVTLACNPGDVAVTTSGGPAGLTVTPASATLTAPVAFSIAAGASVVPGTYPIAFTFSGGGVTRTATLSVTVTAAPDFSLRVDPAQLMTAAGGSGTVNVSVVPLNGFTGNVTVTAPSSPGITFTPATFTLAAGGSQSVAIAIAGDAAAGMRTLLFTGSSPSITGTRSATLTLTTTAAGDFALQVTPAVTDIRPSGSVTVLVRATPVNGFNGVVQVSISPAPGLTFTPPTFTLASGATQTVTIQATALTPGTSSVVRFTGTASSVAARTADLRLNVVAPAPILTSATPPSLVAGAVSSVIRVAGDFFQPGARFVSSNASLIVETSMVLSAKLADVTLRVRSDASPGARELRVVNPDGGTSATPLLIVIYPTSSIAAPLSVSSAAIVHPARGTMIAIDEKLYPRGLLATSGTGTIIGSWRFDGTPFDRFVANAGAGAPVEVRSNVPIPTSHTGAHTLELVIESPRLVTSPSIEIVTAVTRASRLIQLAPREGMVLRGPRPLFRWSLVPNCSGYLVEVARPAESKEPDSPSQILRFRVSDAEWHPTADDLAAIGDGIHRWRVRVVCAGETETEPTPWRTFALLPESADVSMLPSRIDRQAAPVLRWRSDVAGLLHRVEFLAADGATTFAALTPQREYTVPALSFPAGTAVRVSAIAPGGHVLGTSASIPLPRGRSAAIRLIAQTQVELGAITPADGQTVDEVQPRIAAEWKGAIAGDRVSLFVDNVDVTKIATILPASITYDPLLPLSAGAHTVTLLVGEQQRQWSFTIVPAGDASAVPRTGFRGDWVITPVGTITLVRDLDDQARAQFSAQTDLSNGSFSTKSTGDVSVRHDVSSKSTVQESRNWLFDLGAQQGAYRESVRAGFSQPDFLDQSQFLSTGIARGGIQAKVAMPLGSASYYQTFTVKPAGVSAGNFGPDQRVRAAAYVSPLRDRWDVRFLGLTIDDYPSATSAGGKGDALGLFVRYSRGPALRLIAEVARGTFDPDAASFERATSGNAWRLGADGFARSVTYALNLRKTDAGFVNPANRGFTMGGVPDRISGDLSLSRAFGLTNVSVQLRHAQDGTAPEVLLVPKTRQTGVSASVQRSFGSHLSLMVMGNVTEDRGDALETLFMPETDRGSSGGSLTLTESFGVYSFSQTLSRQDLTDRINELSNNATSAVTLTASGAFARWFSLSGVVSGTRSEGSIVVGTTDVTTVSVQPVFNVARLFLSLQPRASYTRSKNDLFGGATASEQAQALLSFAPPWLANAFAIQLSADWSRTRLSDDPGPAPTTRRYVATINLHRLWGTSPGS